MYCQKLESLGYIFAGDSLGLLLDDTDTATDSKGDKDDDDACHQRSAAYERQIEQLHQQLTEALQGNSTDSRTQEPAPDMQQAIDILKRSSLEVELAAKEGEVREPYVFVSSCQLVLSTVNNSTVRQLMTFCSWVCSFAG